MNFYCILKVTCTIFKALHVYIHIVIQHHLVRVMARKQKEYLYYHLQLLISTMAIPFMVDLEQVMREELVK